MSDLSINRGIGLFGGTFDPIHAGHLAVGHGALSALHLARLDFVLASTPWQKSVFTSSEWRAQMVRAAIAREPRFQLNLCEVQREGETFTIDTLRFMRTTLGPSLPLVLICGADQWENFHTWKNWRDFLDYASIALCNRGGRQPKANKEVSDWSRGRYTPPNKLTTFSHGRISEFSIPAHAASSTTIRYAFTTLGRYETLKRYEQWLPCDVARLIARHALY